MMPLSARFISRSAAGGRLVPWFTRGAIKNVALFFAAICSIVVMQSANAGESYPSRPVRLVVPTGAGGNTDTFARVVAEKLKAPLGQQVIVDNRTGASGIVGSDIVAKAAPDGYTLLMAFPSHPVNPLLYSDLPYDTIKDFAPITMVTSVTQVLLVNPKLLVTTVKELIAQAREKPGQFNHGVVGRGSLGDLSAEMFSAMSGARLVQIAYKGAPQVMTALIGGEIQTYFSAPVVAIPQMKAGRVRALGVSTKNRLAVIPDVPTIAEAGLPGYEVVGWNGILAPARTPRAIIDRLHDAIVKVIRTPDVAAAITAQGIEPIGNTPEEFARVIRTDIDKWAKLIKGARTRIN
jgi:tripartite-type tricarboxylate transporter receptor subunit TctC